MKIDGKALAQAILSDLTKQVAILKKKDITPTLVVILVGDNPESLSYIRQKQIATEKIGGRFIFEQLPKVTLPKELAARIAMYNRDSGVHGLIVQRPLPMHFDISINESISPKKDIDGFVTNSPFDVPIAMAVFTILKQIGITPQDKNVVIVGRGETAGKPIAEALAKQQCATSIITSQTPNPNTIMKTADIIISCVGKKGIVTRDALKAGVILMSVGLSRGEDNKLHGDYEEEDVKDIASFYTPTPGGVGPLNIASLMQNLVKACTMK
ncbi:MAG: bifunctional 5,10-methylenetetrahydrofolate dehydrogenase/5,10-methenyltetrahydrofolate cyclohydrolase [Candidatus Gottesmanbacteria bacterium]|nr:bifunctional 5,10-methylenetetrahydrofolate dehydrogenase/5,10-methenyltetrahydrofolate cyclohydrolase [Candidatus Gottesmanbacteria bacterium]